MGWASGSYLAQDLYEEIRPSIPKAKRQKVAEAILSAFDAHDADDWEEGSLLWKDSERPITLWDEEEE